jgi:hypothetical protein
MLAGAARHRYLRAVPTRLLAVALLATLSLPARAADALPPTAADLTGARRAAIGGGRGLAGGNEAIFLNPASLAARKRYAVESQWLLERAGGSSSGQWFTVSAVDSETSTVAGGFAYTRLLSGPSTGHLAHASVAFPLSSLLFAGVTGKYLSLSGADEASAATLDAGLFLRLGRMLSLGVTGYDLVDVGHKQQAPRAVGTGVAIGDDRRFHVTGDWRRDFDRRRDSAGRAQASDSFGGGIEYLAGEYFPLRAGILKDDTRGVRYWSAGVGVVTASGAALDFTYRQSWSDSSERTFLAALKLFLLSD